MALGRDPIQRTPGWFLGTAFPSQGIGACDGKCVGQLSIVLTKNLKNWVEGGKVSFAFKLWRLNFTVVYSNLLGPVLSQYIRMGNKQWSWSPGWEESKKEGLGSCVKEKLPLIWISFTKPVTWRLPLFQIDRDQAFDTKCRPQEKASLPLSWESPADSLNCLCQFYCTQSLGHLLCGVSLIDFPAIYMTWLLFRFLQFLHIASF